MKKALSIFMSLVMLMSMTAGLNLTTQAETLTGSCGDNVTYTLDTETGELVISGTGAMTDYSSSSDVPWYSNRSSIKTVKINSGVTSIGDDAFSNCTSLTSVTIPDSVTSIGWSAFEGCTSLTSVTIPESVTSIGGSAFSSCTSLTSVTIPDSVTSIVGNAFRCVKNIVYNGTATYVSYDENWGANALNGYVDGNLVYSDSSKTVLESCFTQATGEVVIPDTVTKIDDCAFYDCSKVEKVTIPDSVTSIGYSSFLNCSSLISIAIPDSVTSLGDYAFRDCTSLTSVTIPDS